MADKILNMIGLAKKAGRCRGGSYQVESSIKSYEAWLVVAACDASENTKKHLTDMCTYRDIPICFYSTKEQIGKYTGRDEAAAAAILDEGFAKKIEAMIREVQV